MSFLAPIITLKWFLRYSCTVNLVHIPTYGGFIMMLLHNYNYDFNDSLGRRPHAFYFRILKVLNNLRNFFKIETLKSGLIDKITKQVADIYLLSEGAKNLIKNNEIENPVEAYPGAKKILKKIIRYHSALEKVNFFDQKDLKELSELCVANFYEIESNLRQIAYADKKVPEDKELTEFASNLSLSSIQPHP
jgi:hypothetical protein